MLFYIYYFTNLSATEKVRENLSLTRTGKHFVHIIFITHIFPGFFPCLLLPVSSLTLICGFYFTRFYHEVLTGYLRSGDEGREAKPIDWSGIYSVTRSPWEMEREREDQGGKTVIWNVPFIDEMTVFYGKFFQYSQHEAWKQNLLQPDLGAVKEIFSQPPG